MTTAAEARPLAAADSPYVGLTFFTQRSASFFFGRETERALLISNLRASRLTLLYAESGAGKSSLLRAGVAARLSELAKRGLERRGTARHIPVVFSAWRDDPVGGLTGEIRESAAPFAPAGLPSWSPDASLDQVVESAASATDATLLVMLDQFEEYFLYRSRETRSPGFADQLTACVTRGDLRANFLISIREDAYSGLGDLFRGRLANVYGNYLHLEHLNRESARLAIEKPVDSFNALTGRQPPAEIEPELTAAVLDQFRPAQFAAGGGIGRLREPDGAGGADGAGRAADSIAAPYLQLVMKRLWEAETAKGSARLRLATLTELGGAQTIVQTHVDRALAGLGPQDRDAAAEIFRHLITPSGTKIALAADDLADYTGRTTDEIGALLERLTGSDTRILRPVPPPPGTEGGPRFEISHDLLARTIIAWSAEQRARRLENEKKAAQQQAQAETDRARRFRALAVAAAALLAIVVSLLGLTIAAVIDARSAGRDAAAQRNRAVSAQVAEESRALAEHEPLIAPLLAVAAWRIAHTSQADAALLNALAQPDRCVLRGQHDYAPLFAVAFSADDSRLVTAGPGSTAPVWNVATCHLDHDFTFARTVVDSVAISRDGRTLAAALSDGTAQLRDIATHGTDGSPLHAGSGPATAVAFAPDGKILATADADGAVRLWDLTTGQPAGVLRAGSGSATALAFSRDGKLLAAADADGTVRLWRIPAAAGQVAQGSARVLTAPGTGAVYAVAFSPDGRTLATADADGTARLWDVATGRPAAAPLAVSDRAVRSVAFSPDGTILATAGADGVTRLWDLATWQQVKGAPLTVGSIPVYAVAFSPDGKTLATANADGAARLWDRFVYRQIPQGLTAGRARAHSAVFSKDGTMLATAGADGAVRLWRVPSGRLIRSLRASRTGMAYSVAFSKGGAMLAAAGADGIVRLWQVHSGRLIRTFTASRDGAAYSVAFSPVGARLATAGADGTARLWDVVSGREQGPPVQVSSRAVTSVAFSPDGRFLGTASADGRTQLWDAATLRREGDPFRSFLPFESVVFDPVRDIVATASDDGSARLWREESPDGQAVSSSIGTSMAVGSQMYAVAFSPDGRILATASADGLVRLWDVATHQQIGSALAAGPGPVTGVAFSPDGKILATASPRAGTTLWDVFLPRDPAGRACGIIRRPMGRAQWSHYVPPSEPFRPVCPGM